MLKGCIRDDVQNAAAPRPELEMCTGAGRGLRACCGVANPSQGSRWRAPEAARETGICVTCVCARTEGAWGADEQQCGESSYGSACGGARQGRARGFVPALLQHTQAVDHAVEHENQRERALFVSPAHAHTEHPLAQRACGGLMSGTARRAAMAPPEAGPSWGGQWASFLLQCGVHRPPIRPEST